jgi:hypothetical protein
MIEKEMHTAKNSKKNWSNLIGECLDWLALIETAGSFPSSNGTTLDCIFITAL